MVKSQHGPVSDRYYGDVSTNYSDDDYARSLGVEIMAARRMKGLSQEELAQQAGISTRTLSRYELGERDLTLKVLWALTAALDMDAADVLAAAQKRVQKRPQN